MAAKKGGFSHFFYSKVAPIATGLGASVVIVGALFKIMHWPGAGPMLIVGLGTEAVLFAMFAFAPQAHEWDWSKVYPQLREDYSGSSSEFPSEDPALAKKGKDAVSLLGTMFGKANISQDLVDKLGKGMLSLTENVKSIGELGSVTVATSEYAKNIKVASSSLTEMNKSYANVVTSMSEMSGAANDVKKYSEQLTAVTKNLGALNAVYEMELQDANNHIKSMNKFYSNLSSAMENMTEATKDTQQFKVEMGKLTGNLVSLNNVYGGMLSAMKNSL
jgi:gliding motility-associated protein GldL